MIQFEDYHRTVVGYHGTRLSVALDIVNRRKSFESQENEGDWLGRGIYFWEYASQQANWWANHHKGQWDEPAAVLGSMIRLGNCLDLLDPANIDIIKKYHADYRRVCLSSHLSIPVNVKSRRRLDCAVFEYIYTDLDPRGEPRQYAIDSVRGAYVPTDAKKRVWPGSWLYSESHIQICVRNPACILGTWLHTPPTTGVPDGVTEEPIAEDDNEPHAGGGD